MCVLLFCFVAPVHGQAQLADVAQELAIEAEQAYLKAKADVEEFQLETGTTDHGLVSIMEEYEVNMHQAKAESEVEVAMKRRARKNWGEAEILRDLGYDPDARYCD